MDPGKTVFNLAVPAPSYESGAAAAIPTSRVASRITTLTTRRSDTTPTGPSIFELATAKQARSRQQEIDRRNREKAEADQAKENRAKQAWREARRRSRELAQRVADPVRTPGAKPPGSAPPRKRRLSSSFDAGPEPFTLHTEVRAKRRRSRSFNEDLDNDHATPVKRKRAQPTPTPIEHKRDQSAQTDGMQLDNDQ